MSIYIYVYNYIYAYIVNLGQCKCQANGFWLGIYTYTCTYIHTLAHIYIHLHTYTYTCTYIHTLAHVYMHLHIYLQSASACANFLTSRLMMKILWFELLFFWQWYSLNTLPLAPLAHCPMLPDSIFFPHARGAPGRCGEGGQDKQVALSLQVIFRKRAL